MKTWQLHGVVAAVVISTNVSCSKLKQAESNERFSTMDSSGNLDADISKLDDKEGVSLKYFKAAGGRGALFFHGNNLYPVKSNGGTDDVFDDIDSAAKRTFRSGSPNTPWNAACIYVTTVEGSSTKPDPATAQSITRNYLDWIGFTQDYNNDYNLLTAGGVDTEALVFGNDGTGQFFTRPLPGTQSERIGQISAEFGQFYGILKQFTKGGSGMYLQKFAAGGDYVAHFMQAAEAYEVKNTTSAWKNGSGGTTFAHDEMAEPPERCPKVYPGK